VKRAYLEPSAINYLVDSGIDAAEARVQLSESGFEPATGPHTIYELARTFLLPNMAARGMALFQFIERLEPSITPPSLQLMEQELLYLQTGSVVLPFLGRLDMISARLEIAKLARGNLDKQGRDFVAKKEGEIKTSYPESTKPFLQQIEEIKQSDPEIIKRLRDFDSVVAMFGDKMPEMIVDMTLNRIALAEAGALAQMIDRFPAIRTGVRATMHFMWVCISQQVKPSQDKIDDFRHVIEASYCSALVSNDYKLIANVPLVNASLEARRIGDMIRK
jgi:hypothetical protein